MAAFDFFATARRLARRGEPFATATVVRIERPTSGKPGDRAIVTLDGRLHGWVGGSCTRPTVVDEALAALEDGRSRLIRLSSAADERAGREGITDLSMTCFSGGTMEIFIEPHSPRPRLLIVGHQPVAQALAAIGRAIGYEVVAVGGPRPETSAAAGDDGALAEADEILAGTDEIAGHVHPLTAVVVAGHGDHDEIAVEHALASGAPYVGLVASRKRAASIIDYLERQGLAREVQAALRAPAGLDIQARAPEEIALSIIAQIVQARRSQERFDWRGGEAASTDVAAAADDAGAESATDPVCGMTVATAGAQATEYRGTRYYFCCGGCLARFTAEPESFVAGP